MLLIRFHKFLQCHWLYSLTFCEQKLPLDRTSSSVRPLPYGMSKWLLPTEHILLKAPPHHNKLLHTAKFQLHEQLSTTDVTPYELLGGFEPGCLKLYLGAWVCSTRVSQHLTASSVHTCTEADSIRVCKLPHAWFIYVFCLSLWARARQ